MFWFICIYKYYFSTTNRNWKWKINVQLQRKKVSIKISKSSSRINCIILTVHQSTNRIIARTLNWVWIANIRQETKIPRGFLTIVKKRKRLVTIQLLDFLVFLFQEKRFHLEILELNAGISHRTFFGSCILNRII